MSLAEEILAAQEPQMALTEIPVPEWGTSVYMGGLSAFERDELEDVYYTWKDKPGFRARLLVRFLKHADGTRIFTDEQADALAGKHDAVIDRLFNQGTELSGISKGTAETIAKN